MYKGREILRLRWVLGLGVRQAVASAGVERSVVSKTTVHAEASGLDWAAVEAISDTELEDHLLAELTDDEVEGLVRAVRGAFGGES